MYWMAALSAVCAALLERQSNTGTASILLLLKRDFLQRIAAVNEQSPIWGQSHSDPPPGARAEVGVTPI
jgi:hypothetical protein